VQVSEARHETVQHNATYTNQTNIIVVGHIVETLFPAEVATRSFMSGMWKRQRRSTRCLDMVQVSTTCSSAREAA